MARPPPADASGSGALGVLAATVPAMVLGTEINEAVCGDETLPVGTGMSAPRLAALSR